MAAEPDYQAKFWRIFGRVMERGVDRDHYVAGETDAWDSLRHVELMFELEEAFDLDISSDEIVELYSDTNVVLEFLAKKTGVNDS